MNLKDKIKEIYQEEFEYSKEYIFQKISKLEELKTKEEIINFALCFDSQNLEILSKKIGFDFLKDRNQNLSKRLLN